MALVKNNLFTCEFEHDIFMFSCAFEFIEGDDGDGWNTPPVSDQIMTISVSMISYTTEEGNVIKLDKPCDVTYIINDDVKKDMHIAITNFLNA